MQYYKKLGVCLFCNSPVCNVAMVRMYVGICSYAAYRLNDGATLHYLYLHIDGDVFGEC